MKDLIPVENTMSDEQFNQLILMSDHAPGGEPLSSATQTVEKAYFNADGFGYRKGLAAALRAAVDKVVPKAPLSRFATPYEKGIWDGKDDVRDELLAIADELEAQS